MEYIENVDLMQLASYVVIIIIVGDMVIKYYIS